MESEDILSRRQMLAVVGASCVAAMGSTTAPEVKTQSTTSVGLASNVFDMRRAAEAAAGEQPSISDPMQLLKTCRELGAGGIQGPLGARDEAYAGGLRRFAEEHGLYIEASIALPANDAAAERFEREVLTAKAAGAPLARTVAFPGRRYETFDSLEQFGRASQQALQSLERAERIARRHQFRLALENHKDQRVSERLEMLKRLGSEYVGTCVDIGNSFALCEDPLDVVRAYAPLAWTVHLKDQALGEYDQGFLFADAPLGKGFLDLGAIVGMLRQANPRIHFNLEVMTRDPLRVPVLTSRYWATMPNVPASELAATLRIVKASPAREPLPRISGLSPQERVSVETRNITQSLDYARTSLKM